jgi:protein gp37
METSKISWCDNTHNHWVGCAHASDGCRFCYAEDQQDHRFGRVVWGPNGTRVLTTAANRRKPLQWNREAEAASNRPRVFAASLSDVFEDRADLIDWRADLFQLIRKTPNLDWLLLTKRAECIEKMLPKDWGNGYKNVWLGTSVEDIRVTKRIDHLRKIPAVVRFVSYEPAIGPLGDIDLDGIDWLICGGESGRNHRPMDVGWARSIRDQCLRQNVTFFYKQAAGLRPGSQPTLDGVEHHNFPVPRITIAA